MFQRLSLSSLVVFSFACGVEPLPSFHRAPLVAQSVPLNVLFLVDSSGSMESPIDPLAPSCDPGCGPGSNCPAGCVTRWSLAKDLVTTTTGMLPAQAMVGLSLFPTGPACGGPTALDESFSPRPTLHPLHGRLPVGGTPTAAALRLAGTLPRLQDPAADNVVVLVTDGLPNCNEQHPENMCAGPSMRCRCTLSSCAQLCAVGCLDDDATLQAARALGQQGIQLVTVTVGPEWATPGALTLAGALGEVSVASAGCGANCQGVVLSVLDAADQLQAGQQLGARLAGCAWSLPGLVAPAELDVEVDHGPLSPADYALGGQRVWLGHEACARVRAGADLAFFAR